MIVDVYFGESCQDGEHSQTVTMTLTDHRDKKKKNPNYGDYGWMKNLSQICREFNPENILFFTYANI